MRCGAPSYAPGGHGAPEGSGLRRRDPFPPTRRLRAHHPPRRGHRDRKSTRLNSSHSQISYAVFCLKKKKTTKRTSYIIRNRSASSCSREAKSEKQCLNSSHMTTSYVVFYCSKQHLDTRS